MAMAWSVSRMMAIMSTTRCQGWVRMPREIISVVAPAGACDARNRIIKLAVSPRESAAAITRAHVTPFAIAGPTVVKPVTTRLK